MSREEPRVLTLVRALRSDERRCGVTSADSATGCCRPDRHAGAHCRHSCDDLTGTPSIVAARGGGLRPGAAARTYCDGTRHPVGDRLEPAARGAAERSRFVLDTPAGES